MKVAFNNLGATVILGGGRLRLLPKGQKGCWKVITPAQEKLSDLIHFKDLGKIDILSPEEAKERIKALDAEKEAKIRKRAQQAHDQVLRDAGIDPKASKDNEVAEAIEAEEGTGLLVDSEPEKPEEPEEFPEKPEKPEEPEEFPEKPEKPEKKRGSKQTRRSKKR